MAAGTGYDVCTRGVFTASETALRMTEPIPLSVPPLVLPPALCHLAQAKAAPLHTLYSCEGGTCMYQTSSMHVPIHPKELLGHKPYRQAGVTK